MLFDIPISSDPNLLTSSESHLVISIFLSPSMKSFFVIMSPLSLIFINSIFLFSFLSYVSLFIKNLNKLMK